MTTEQQNEHKWLDRFLGEWTYEVDSGKPEKPKGTESVRSIGGLWIQGEGRGEMPGGGPSTTLMTLGFDPQKKRFVGSWIGSMMAYFWVYDGWLDASGDVLTLESEGPSMAGDGTLSMYRDVVEFVNDDYRKLTAHSLKEDGSWSPFMTMHFRRVT